MGAWTGIMSDGRGKGEGRFIIGRRLNIVMIIAVC